jgi:hypothetical protein
VWAGLQVVPRHFLPDLQHVSVGTLLNLHEHVRQVLMHHSGSSACGVAPGRTDSIAYYPRALEETLPAELL